MSRANGGLLHRSFLPFWTAGWSHCPTRMTSMAVNLLSGQSDKSFPEGLMRRRHDGGYSVDEDAGNVE